MNFFQNIKTLCKSSKLIFAVAQSPKETHNLSAVPEVYHDPGKVFSKQRVLSLPPHKPCDCAINLLPGAPLPSSRLYSLSRPECEAMETYIRDSLAAGIIRPFSSPVGAVFFFVAKKGCTLRLCIDFCGLNNIRVKNKYPLPPINAAFEPLQGATIFSKLDLRNACCLVCIREEDEWKTVFNIPLDHFEYLVMPFGLTSAPAVFQAPVNAVLHDFLNQSVFIYLDDILIFSLTLEEHVQRLKETNCLLKLRNSNFMWNLSDSWAMSSREWPIPTTRKQLQQFLEFANFYRRFIRYYSRMAAPLTHLLEQSSLLD